MNQEKYTERMRGFLQNGRSAQTDDDPAADEQPDVPAFTPSSGRRGG